MRLENSLSFRQKYGPQWGSFSKVVRGIGSRFWCLGRIAGMSRSSFQRKSREVLDGLENTVNHSAAISADSSHNVRPNCEL